MALTIDEKIKLAKDSILFLNPEVAEVFFDSEEDIEEASRVFTTFISDQDGTHLQEAAGLTFEAAVDNLLNHIKERVDERITAAQKLAAEMRKFFGPFDVTLPEKEGKKK